MVVDDQEQNRRLLGEVLSHFGYHTEFASSGSEALAKLTPDFDLVLLDIVMQGMDGFEVIQTIRQDPEVRGIPVIVVTVLDDRETRIRAVEAGANDFIAKPIDNVEVRVRIEALLRMKEAQDALKSYKAELEETVRQRTADLEKSEFRYRMVADFTYDWEYWQDYDGKLLFVSSSCKRITGYSAAEFISDPSLIIRIVHPDDQPMAQRHFEEVMRTGDHTGTSIDFRIVCKDGTVAWINHACIGVRSEDGARLGIRVSNRNVTSEKRLEQALNETRDLARLVVDKLPVAIMYVDAGQRFVMANRTYLAWLGRNEDDLRDLHVSEVLGGRYEEAKPHIEQALRGQESRYESTIEFGDGQTRHVNVVLVPHFGSDGQIKGFGCLVSDVTEARRTEMELLRIRNAVDGATDAIAMATAGGEHFYQNRAFSHLFGYEIDDLRGSHGPSRAYRNPEVAKRIFETITFGGIWNGEVEMVTKDGRSLQIYVRANPISDTEGKIVSVLGVHTDVTNLKQIQTDLKTKSEALTASENRFATLFERSQDCIFFKDKSLRYIDVNPAMTELFAIPRSDFRGKTDGDLFGEEVFGRTSKLDSRVLSGQVIENQEILSVGDLPLCWSVLRFPLQETDEDILGLCGIAREMDEAQQSSLKRESALPQRKYPSSAMRSLMEAARNAATVSSTVLLTGETGSGKDYLARYIHENSSDHSGPFLSVNCASIPVELAESELFGHEAGAFTGAHRRKRGMVEMAEGGTLLLNEIGDLPQSLQAKLLTFLDTFSFQRVGGEKKITVKTKVIAATSKDLWREVGESRFRLDLYYRLNVYPIRVPSLRERLEDIPTLVAELIAEIASQRGMPLAPKIPRSATARLMTYSWPGNVRELRNVLERALILSKGGSIHSSHLIIGESGNTSALPRQVLPTTGKAYDILEAMERSFIEDALRRSRGRKEEASHLLGISRYALARRLKKLGLNVR